MSSSTNMTYTRLGKSGLKISRIILGCMSYGRSSWFPWVLDEEESIKHIKAAYDMGINTFDTANVYSNGDSERVLGNAIKKLNLPRDEIVIMTKLCQTVGRGEEVLGFVPKEQLEQQRYTNQQGLSRKHIFEAVKRSLERLQLDYIDVLQCHRFDYDTPIEETMQALHDVVQAGYVRYIGMCSCYAWQFYKMQSYAKEHGLTQFISMQNLYNAVYREEEREMMPMLKELGVGMIAWSPMGGGYLARPLDGDTIKTTRNSTDMNAQFMQAMANVPYVVDLNKAMQEIAKAHGVSLAQVNIAWALSKGEPYCAPIVGTTSVEKLKDLVGALDLKLTPEEVKRIDDFYQPRSVFAFF